MNWESWIEDMPFEAVVERYGALRKAGNGAVLTHGEVVRIEGFLEEVRQLRAANLKRSMERLRGVHIVEDPALRVAREAQVDGQLIAESAARVKAAFVERFVVTQEQADTSTVPSMERKAVLDALGRTAGRKTRKPTGVFEPPIVPTEPTTPEDDDGA